jgi:hypothetical protein
MQHDCQYQQTEGNQRDAKQPQGLAASVRILFHLGLRMNTPSGLILSQQA